MSSKLWDKGYQLDKEIETFTVGEDYLLDESLIRADVIGNVAHARMLTKIGVLTDEEFSNLRTEFVNILNQEKAGQFKISPADEDVHTKIENYLTEKLGDLGKKIHAARSRNDQVICDLRLYTKEQLFKIKEESLTLCQTLHDFSNSYKETPMAGRTHCQIAMPSSVGLWAAAFMESLLDDLSLLDIAFELNDQSPLGSAASYGVSLNIDRKFTSDLLGFKQVQNNVLYVNNSRGKIESIVLSALVQIAVDLSKITQDLITFTMPEFSYFQLPEELYSGSSIMPQKRNPCGLELVRAKSATIISFLIQILGVIKALPSGYNRDFQETKASLLKGLKLAEACLKICNLTFKRLTVNEENLLKGFTAEIFATDQVLELVKQGIPFREAYRQVAKNLGGVKAGDAKKNIRKKKHQGATGNLGLEISKERIKKESKDLQHKKKAFSVAITELLGISYPF